MVTQFIDISDGEDSGLQSSQSVNITMTSETEILASKMPSAEGHLGPPKGRSGVQVAHPFPEQSLRFNQEKPGAVDIPDISQLEIQCKIRGRDTWWEWYYGRYNAFFEHANSVDPLTLKLDYLDSDSVRLSKDGEEIERDLCTVAGNVPFPGPLVRGETDHMAVYRYILTQLQRCISDDSMEDKEGAVMVWRMLALMWRKDGMVSVRDVAILLLQQLRAAQSSGSHTVELDLIELLILGKREEALNLAMENEYWEHALVLDTFFRKASCVPSIVRFINRLDDWNLMKTFYEIYLGKIPGVISKCEDMMWSEWCPHLAIILANCSCPLRLKDIVTTLADKFELKGQLWMVHFCFMAIQTVPSYYHPNSKLTLIGQDSSLPFKAFAAGTAIERMEVYEYLLPLSQKQNFPYFQDCKIMYAWRLFRAGRIAEAFKYTEVIAKFFLATSARLCPAMSRLLELCDALPQMLPDWVEPPWMSALKKLAVDADQEVPSKPGQDSEQAQLDLVGPAEPAEIQACNTSVDEEMSRPASAESVVTVVSVVSADSVIHVRRSCISFALLRGNPKRNVGKRQNGCRSSIGWGTSEQFCPSGSSCADRVNDPVLPENAPKKKKNFWTRCFCWCGKAEE